MITHSFSVFIGKSTGLKSEFGYAHESRFPIDAKEYPHHNDAGQPTLAD
jgi:hypothetical protein